MYLRQETDYAIRIVYCLTISGKRCDSTTLSEKMNVSIRFALKILGRLSSAGIVKSFKGNHGGYELARSPYEISLKDVVDVIEGEPYVMTKCTSGTGECNRGATGSCAFRGEFVELASIVNNHLSGVSFGSMLDKYISCEPHNNKE